MDKIFMDSSDQTFTNGHVGSPDSKQIIDGLPAAIYTCDKEGRITYFNKAAEDLWGCRPVIGKDSWCGSWKIYTAFGTQIALESSPMAITLKEGRSVEGVEIIIERPDGIRRNVMPHPKPLFDPDGNLAGAINMLVDITALRLLDLQSLNSEEKYRSLSELLEKKVEERTFTLKKSEERYHKMIEEVQDYAILLLDKDGNILNWNKGAEKIKGYTEAEIVGKNFRIFYLDKDRKDMLPESLIAEASEKGKAMHEGWRLKKDGSTFWGQIVITALHDDENNIIGFSKVTRDLTERKLSEDQINFRNRQLEEYAHIASHDLQEPLRKIQIFSGILRENLEDREKAEKILDKIESSAKRMVILIKDVLKYAQLSNTDDLFVSVDLNEILEKVLEDYELMVAEKGVEFICSGLPVIEGIPIQLQQLFSNLLGNSMKFSGKNPVIEISAEKAGAEEIKKNNLLEDLSYNKILFKDNGVGFDSTYADHIFKLFQRLHSNTAGTGIGLALCKKVVENHRGSIEVSSEINKGTIFSIFLPLQHSAD